MKENWVYRRGDLYLANLGVPVGSKQGGVRPVVVLQNDVGNYYSPTITIAPLTSKIEKKRKQPTHFFLRKAKGLAKPSMVLAEQLDTCDKICVIRYLGRVSKGQMRGIDEAVRIQLGYYIPEQSEKKRQGKCTRTQGLNKSQNKGHVQSDQAAAYLLHGRSACWRTAFLFAQKTYRKQCSGYVYDAGYEQGGKRRLSGKGNGRYS